MGTCKSVFGKRAGGQVHDGLVVPAGGYEILHAKAGAYAIIVIKGCQSLPKAYKQTRKWLTLDQ